MRVTDTAHPGARGDTPLRLTELYERLFRFYGPQHWWLAEGTFEMIVGAILTQNTSWKNVERAIARLKETGNLSPEAIARMPSEELAELIRSSGFFRMKARKLKAFVEHLEAHHNGRLESLFDRDASELRRELLGIHGIGPETADSIVLYGAGKPTFVVDAYTCRLFERLGLLSGPTYDHVQQFCHENLPTDAPLFNEFHALIVRHSVVHCRKRPLCAGCPLVAHCPSARFEESSGAEGAP